ncbi:MAG: MFS transporter [Vicinamibacteria bacterium]
MTPATDRLFTARFLTMCAFTFTVFLSAFQLFPTAPFRILDLGGTKADAGLFLGFLTYASAFSAPVTGALADRLGKRSMLVACGLVITLFSVGYALSSNYKVPLALAFLHGLFWSGLLSASAAYMTDTIPESRRAEGIGYWGLATIIAIAIAPNLGLWLYRRGWTWLCASTGVLNLGMAAIAATLPDTDPPGPVGRHFFTRDLVEWRVVVLSVALFLYSFGYGGITSFSALCAASRGVAPNGIYFTTFALVVLVTRPLISRFADRIGYLRVFYPCLALIVVGLGILAATSTRQGMIVSALVFGVGFGAAYPVYVAHLMKHVDPARRGAAFGGILAAFDTGIGTGSIATGFIVEHAGYGAAFGFAALLSSLAVPYFSFVEPRILGPVRREAP